MKRSRSTLATPRTAARMRVGELKIVDSARTISPVGEVLAERNRKLDKKETDLNNCKIAEIGLQLDESPLGVLAGGVPVRSARDSR